MPEVAERAALWPIPSHSDKQNEADDIFTRMEFFLHSLDMREANASYN